MSYKPRTLFRILEEISRNELLLPHIQRAFVWDEEQMARLFDSLMRNYPIQTLLFWRTKEAIKARKFMTQIDRDVDLSSLYDSAKSAGDIEKTFVLDGQQRLQTLHAIFGGGILNSERDETHACFDVTQGSGALNGGDLWYQLVFSPNVLGLPHYRIRNLLEKDAQKDSATIADDLNDELSSRLQESDEQRKNRERLVRRNIQQLRSLLREEQHFWIEELDGVANSYEYRRILDIFVRVNSGGTKLTAPDLMFAAMKEGWEDIEEHTEETVEMLNDGRLGFDKDFPLKCLLVTHGKGAEVSVEKFIGANGEILLSEMEREWDKAEKTFQQLRDFILHELRLSSDKVVRSYNAFVPIFDYLFHSTQPTPRDRILMRAYYNKAQLFNWFGSSTDGVINALHNIVGCRTDGFPLDAVKNYFATSRGLSVALGESHLNDNRLRSIILSMVYVECWSNSPFNVRYKGNEPHVDHIYPQYMLRSRLNQRSSEINDIGNLRFVGATDNIRKRAELPASYFARLKGDGVDIAKHLLVSEFADDPSRLTFDVSTYSAFRAKRRAEIYSIAKRVIDPELRSIDKPSNSTAST